jgi:hypothetical protein
LIGLDIPGTLHTSLGPDLLLSGWLMPVPGRAPYDKIIFF